LGDLVNLLRDRDVARHDQGLAATVFYLPGYRFQKPDPSGGKD